MAMLLYEAPTGIAIFSFDGDYLNDSVEDFWECLPPLNLEEFIKNETVPSPLDTMTKAIDDHLAKRLTELCGSEKKLVVGNVEYKRIIEMNLRITCLHVHVPDCKVVICSLKNPMYTLLPRKLPNPDEDLIFFLKQHYIGCKPEMVNDYIIKEAHILHENESLEKEHLKFFRILLKDFLVKSCIDAKNWNAIHFATALKVICYPKASYEVYRPDKIFPCGVHQKMKDHSSEYDTMFAKIDALSVYNFVISLSSEKFLILSELDILVTKAKEELKIAGAIRCKDRSPGKRKTNRIDL
ncbi:uncharacterized protein [Triticum aestivum]|uniref:uncharacterized protein n=1 Tax=Triticum aestivum TaxID=4565 RepID=UPI001D025D63|nr:uncharacterized protein LOC123039711 [Triticum aestivum]